MNIFPAFKSTGMDLSEFKFKISTEKTLLPIIEYIFTKHGPLKPSI